MFARPHCCLCSPHQPTKIPITNLIVGAAAWINPKTFGPFGVATGINDVYGKEIARITFEGAMAISPNIPHPKPESNSLDNALEIAFVNGSR